MAPETFSSEIGDVHERGDRDSFSNEFRGASDSLLEHRPPPRPLDVGRRGRRLMLIIFLVVGVLGGGGFAFWYWSAEIGGWIAGLGRSTEEPEPATTEPETPAEVPPATTDETAPPAEPEPEPEKVFGIRGAPGEPLPVPPPEGQGQGDPAPTKTDAPPAPPPTPVVSAKVETTATDVRGKLSSASVSSRLTKVDEALGGCWAKAVSDGATAAVELELSFDIKWNGRIQGLTVTGGSQALQTCVREALPSSGWPQPRDGGEARVTRSWKLGG